MAIRFILAVALALIVSLGNVPQFQGPDGRAFAQQAETVVQAAPASTRDQEIQSKVRSLLREIPAYKNVFVTVKGGVVTLKGLVLELEAVVGNQCSVATHQHESRRRETTTPSVVVAMGSWKESPCLSAWKLVNQKPPPCPFSPHISQ